jgi:CDGSH-type Zn-finger protein
MGDGAPSRRIGISVTPNGPYAVTGQVPLAKSTIGVNSAGESVAWVQGAAFDPPAAYFLCRCGQSHTKPFCDGTHAKIAFDGTETATDASYLEQAQEFDGPVLVLTDAQVLCAFGRFCDRNGSVWREVSSAETQQAVSSLVEQVHQCPSGRLVTWDRRSQQPLEPEEQPAILLVEDPQQGVSGPIWVRGGIQLIGADGRTYEVRNRVTLCRCGQSRNKPFCDGSHVRSHFVDT